MKNKKQIVIIAIAVIFCVFLFGCKSNKQVIPDSTENYEPITFSDDEVISFGDEDFLNDIRDTIGVSEGDITYADVKNIRELKLWGPEEGYTDLSPLKYFTGLRVLSISSKYDTDLSVLSNCTELTELYFQGKVLESLNGIQGCKNLVTVEIAGNGEETGAVAIGGTVGETDVVANVEVTNVTVANEGNYEAYTTEINVEAISNCPKLRHLNVNSFANEELNFGKMESLEELTISCPNLSDVNFSGMEKLNSLKLYGPLNKISFEGLENLENMEIGGAVENIRFEGLSNLKSLDIEVCLSTSMDFAGLDNLTDLRIRGCSSTSMDFAELENLTNLNISECRNIEHIDFNGLGNLKDLQINMCNNIENMDFTGLNNIEHLAVWDCASLEDVDLIGVSPSIVQIDFIRCGLKKLSVEGAENLEGLWLDECDSLKDLELIGLTNLVLNNSNSFRIDGCDNISSLLIDNNPSSSICKSFPSLTNLVLKNMENLSICDLIYEANFPVPLTLSNLSIQNCSNYLDTECSSRAEIEEYNLRNQEYYYTSR